MMNKKHMVRIFLGFLIAIALCVNIPISTALAVGAAYFSHDTTLQVTISGVNYDLTVIAGSDADSVVVNTSSIEVTMSVSQRFILASSDRLTLSNDGGFITTCTLPSTLDLRLTPGASQTTITITPTTSLCSGGGGSAPVGDDVATVNHASRINPNPLPLPPSLTPQSRVISTIAPTPLPAQPVNTTNTGAIRVITGIPYLNVRSAPSTKGKILAKVTPGQILQYADMNKGWYLIKKSGKDLGWVLGEYIVRIDTASKSHVGNAGTLRVAPGFRYLNVRTSPSIRGKIVGRALSSQEYQFSDISSGWYLIQNKGRDFGWVSGEYTQTR